MVQPVDADVFCVSEINGFRCKKFGARDSVGILALFHIPRYNILYASRQRNIRAFLPAKNVIQHIHRELVLVFRHQHFVPALLQIIDRSTGRHLQGGYRIRLLIAAVAPECFIFKDNEKSAGRRFAGTDAPHQLQVILLEHMTVGVCLPFHLPAHDFRMLVDIRTLCQHLKLDFDRADFKIADKGINNAALLSGAAQQEIDRLHFKNLDVPVVFGVDNAVFNLFNGKIGSHRIQKFWFGLQSAWPRPFFPLFLFLWCGFPGRFFFFCFSRPFPDNPHNLSHHGRLLILSLLFFTSRFLNRLLFFHRLCGRFLFRNDTYHAPVFQPFEESKDKGRQTLARYTK